MRTLYDVRNPRTGHQVRLYDSLSSLATPESGSGTFAAPPGSISSVKQQSNGGFRAGVGGSWIEQLIDGVAASRQVAQAFGASPAEVVSVNNVPNRHGMGSRDQLYQSMNNVCLGYSGKNIVTGQLGGTTQVPAGAIGPTAGSVQSVGAGGAAASSSLNNVCAWRVRISASQLNFNGQVYYMDLVTVTVAAGPILTVATTVLQLAIVPTQQIVDMLVLSALPSGSYCMLQTGISGLIGATATPATGSPILTVYGGNSVTFATIESINQRDLGSISDIDAPTTDSSQNDMAGPFRRNDRMLYDTELLYHTSRDEARRFPRRR